MTEKLLKQLGFIPGRMNRVFHPDTEIEIRVNSLRHCDPQWLVSEFGRQMFEYGKNTGAIGKVNEIKKALNIEL